MAFLNSFTFTVVGVLEVGEGAIGSEPYCSACAGSKVPQVHGDLDDCLRWADG